ncbi:MAG: hypothetical protein NZM25_02440 [Leptospiraceae bacterium]|nr:hypothetical protein [Leptospiraceae bacterium]MDW8307672.1 hypothetical protein [Leptospiraceae bacterium]
MKAFFLLLFLILSCASKGNIYTSQGESQSPKPPKKEKAILLEEDLAVPEQKDFVGEPITLEESRELSFKKAAEARKASPARKREGPPLYYSGDEFSREIVPNKNPREGTILRITGHAYFRRGNYTLVADKIEVFGEDAAYVRATGNILFQNKKEHLTVKAPLAEYYRGEARLIIKGNPVAEKIFPKEGTKAVLICQEFERNFEEKFSLCRKQVRFQKGELSGFAAMAFLHEEKSELTLKENPRIFQRDHILMADEMVLSRQKDRDSLYAKNNVKIYYLDQKKVSSLVEAHELLLEKSPKIHLGQKTTLWGSPVSLRHRDFVVYAKKAEIWGENGEEVFLEKEVKAVQKKDGSYLEGEKLWFYRFLGIAKMDTVIQNGQKRRPRGYFFAENGSDSAVVEADSFERNIFFGRIQARGQVEILITHSSEKTLLKGGWAELEEEKERLTIHGNPSIQQEEREISAKQIVLFYRQRKMELWGPLHGKLSAVGQKENL